MDEVFTRRDLIEPALLRRLCAPSNVRGALQLGSHCGALALTAFLLWRYRASVWAVPLFVLEGILLNFLYAAQHELSHWTVFKTRWPNEWAGRLIGFLLFYPRTFDQLQHLAHHRYTQDWTRDGELGRPAYTLHSYLLWMSGLSYWYSRWRRIARFCLARVSESYIAPQRRAELVREARIHAAAYAGIAVLSVQLHAAMMLLLLWFAPLVVMKPVHQLQNTIEHLGRPHTANVLLNTRSTRTNALMRWLAWQMQYHTAHHAFPGVPFHRLRKLDAALSAARGIEAPSMSYLGFQVAALRALARVGDERDYADGELWISDSAHA